MSDMPPDAETQPLTPEQTPEAERPEKEPEGRSPGEATPRSPDDDSMEGPAPTG